ncbi:MAG: response regulator transcription factor [Candidatus Obscuribacterales bacterium]|nr:response regulator transcription factor [Candidatus Obscuribacterales bacterium]
MAKILIVDDDLSLAANIKRWLEFENHLVEHTGSGSDALNLMKSFTYDVIVLDINLPHMSGFDVCQSYRDSGGQSPIIMLTTKDQIEDKELGFGSGADDYLSKPFNLKELSLRIKGLLKRSRDVTESVLQSGEVILNPTAKSVSVAGKLVSLQNLEFRILELLLRNKGSVLSTDSILERTADFNAERSPESLRTAIKKLRKKIDIEGSASIISNVHGVGYKISD